MKISKLSFGAFALSFLLTPMVKADSLAAPLGYAGCGRHDFTVMDREEQVIRTTPDNMFEPRCLRVRAGTAVTIEASTEHPVQGVGRHNPLVRHRGPALAPKTYVFNRPGLYGYYCQHHGTPDGSGMAGLIMVTE